MGRSNLPFMLTAGGVALMVFAGVLLIAKLLIAILWYAAGGIASLGLILLVAGLVLGAMGRPR